MLNSITIKGSNYEFELASPIDISIPLNFNGAQPNAYGVDPAISTPYETGELVGDTRQGGSCNFEEYTLIPHCNGTHTECVGHITRERISVRECLKDVLMTAVLTTIYPESDDKNNEKYSSEIQPDDLLISRRALEQAESSKADALIIRTLPNDDRKLAREYAPKIPPYFTSEAIDYIVEHRFKHLVVDLPSIDRLYDEGRLSNHRAFWNVDTGSYEVNPATRIGSTITELAYIPNKIEDGVYLLNLQIAPFASDASPSRPILFRVIEKN
jgi:arylformamidase